MIFLQEASIFNTDTASTVPLLALIGAFLIAFVIFITALYVYTSLVFMAIARKAKYPSPGIAWIPIIGPALITSKTANMHWWPILFYIGFGFPYLNFIIWIPLTVFSIIWLYKTYEVIGKPGWWAILMLIPP